MIDREDPSRRVNWGRVSGFALIALLTSIFCGSLVVFLPFSSMGGVSAQSFPIAMHSVLQADYGADPVRYVVPVVDLSLVDQAIRDAENEPDIVERINDLFGNLRTPVPTVTPADIQFETQPAGPLAPTVRAATATQRPQKPPVKTSAPSMTPGQTTTPSVTAPAATQTKAPPSRTPAPPTHTAAPVKPSNTPVPANTPVPPTSVPPTTAPYPPPVQPTNPPVEPTNPPDPTIPPYP